MPSHVRGAAALHRLRFCVAALAGWSLVVAAQTSQPGPRPDEQFDFMNLLRDHGLHNIDDESWNAYGQFTYISSWKLGFPAAYTNLNGSTNSLLPGPERSFTGTFTVFLGVRLWSGAEVYVVPEVIAEHPLSQLRGLGGAIQNFELQKGGADTPQVYRAQTFLRQTIELGGDRVVRESQPLALGRVDQSRRLVLELGSFTILDFFDKAPFGVDPRQGLFSLAFVTHPAYDFASDARGYSWGGVAELYWDDWAVRFGRITPPKNPNQPEVDFRLYEFYGDQLEIEHRYRLLGQEGIVRILGYHNHVNTGRFTDAVNALRANPLQNAATCPADRFSYGSTNATAPDLCWVRRPNDKLGIGLYAEQYVAPDIGLFARAMYSDGQTEVYAYTAADASFQLGALAKGTLWHRPRDRAGLAVDFDWISAAHAQYLRLGGIDGFVGDGNLTSAPESSLDVFYSFSVVSSIWLSADYQHIVDPGFNAARGPVDVFGVRVHAEF